ncbi:MAG TPA: glycine--tRNA ligase subunit beta [Thermoanaerobaculia bacterium]|jgi:glycyl-tRNA synthetase beta chain|nr:glycine--tRNA ligase subunit beta [Thermoanaerobaculia bacterium]
MSEYFFELLAEEIPAWMHDAAQTALKEKLTHITNEANITINSTPRRIAIYLSNLPLKDEDREQEVKGPPKKSAFDGSGKPTQALQGFLKKNNATVEDILDSGDEYVRIRRRVEGKKTTDLLRERVPQIVESLRWPKMMRWGTGDHAYIRPVHSVVSVFDGEHLPIEIFGVASSTQTVGHRILAPAAFGVTSYNDYVTKLELARVVVDAMRRRHVMAERARVLGNEVRGTPSIEASIWSQWQYLTEYPGVVRAEFRREYLVLPEEVLVTVMRVHQKQLPIRDAHEKLTPYFLAVLDNEADPDGNAAYGNSFVTNARFADAKFFYETDRKKKLEERVESLSHLQFQEQLGNYLEKTKRIRKIAEAINGEIGGDQAALRAAGLCKADLVTEMVKEFTDLQGRIGGIYAREEGEPLDVWQAIYDHYQPVNIDDSLPRTISGAVVSLADRIDTLVGFFRIGAKPSGSKDPFALRRAAQGVVQILLNRDQRQIRVGVDRLIDFGIEAHGVAPAIPPADAAAIGGSTLKHDLLAFFAERVRTILEASAYGFAYDEIAAAMEAGWASSLTDLVDRLEALKAMRNEANFLSILDSAKRIANITTGHQSTRVDASKLENDVEKRLDQLADAVSEQIDEMIADRRYRSALESFAAMAPELERFFKDVMVMVDDEGVRKNRMSLLRKVGGAVMKVADVTKIVVDRRDYRA